MISTNFCVHPSVWLKICADSIDGENEQNIFVRSNIEGSQNGRWVRVGGNKSSEFTRF